MRVIFDHNTPRGLRALLAGHEIVTTRERGWSELANGDLLTAAEAAGFEVMVTCDQSLIHQQNMTRRKLALVVLTTNLWTVIRENAAAVAAGIDQVAPGHIITVRLPRPPLPRSKPSGPLG